MSSPLWTTDLIPGQFDGDINQRFATATIDYLKSPNRASVRMGRIVPTNRPFWKGTITTLVGNVGEVAEGIQEAPPIVPQKVKDMYVSTRLIKGVLAVSRELMEDDAPNFNYVKDLTPKFAERGPKFIEIDFANKFLNTATVFDATRDVRDGVALLSAVHPAGVSGYTYGNTFAGAQQALGEAGVLQAIAYYRGGIYDDAGDLTPLDVNEFILGVHPSKEGFARQLANSLSSTTDYKNSGVNNPLNDYFKVTVIALPYLTNPNMWVLTPVGKDSGLITLMRTAPQAPESITRQNPDQMQWQVRFRYGMFVLEPRYFFASTP